MMRPRATYLFTLLDYAIGAFFVTALFVGGIMFLTLTGAPKQYELQALGAAYTKFLSDIEDGARDLRDDYCARADAETAAEAECEAAPASGDA